MITYPNQKIIHINKETTSNFLQVDKEDWMNACNELTYNAFKVYLYLAGNQDGFDLALSKKALLDVIKMSDNTYTNVIKELTEKSYLVQKQGNIYDFYTIPHSNGIPQYTGVVYPNTVGDNTPIECGSIPQSTGGEIDKRDKKDIFYISESEQSSSSNGANAPVATPPAEREKKRTLEDLSNEELKSLKKDFEQEVKYTELYKKYNLAKNQLDKTLCSKIDAILSKRDKEDKYNKIKERLTEDTKQELMNITNLKEDSLVEYLSALEVDALPEELIVFFEEHPIFTYKVWITEYAHLEDYRNQTYFDWFVNGVNGNFKEW